MHTFAVVLSNHQRETPHAHSHEIQNAKESFPPLDCPASTFALHSTTNLQRRMRRRQRIQHIHNLNDPFSRVVQIQLVLFFIISIFFYITSEENLTTGNAPSRQSILSLRWIDAVRAMSTAVDNETTPIDNGTASTEDQTALRSNDETTIVFENDSTIENVTTMEQWPTTTSGADELLSTIVSDTTDDETTTTTTWDNSTNLTSTANLSTSTTFFTDSSALTTTSIATTSVRDFVIPSRRSPQKESSEKVTAIVTLSVLALATGSANTLGSVQVVAMLDAMPCKGYGYNSYDGGGNSNTTLASLLGGALDSFSRLFGGKKSSSATGGSTAYDADPDPLTMYENGLVHYKYLSDNSYSRRILTPIKIANYGEEGFIFACYIILASLVSVYIIAYAMTTRFFGNILARAGLYFPRPVVFVGLFLFPGIAAESFRLVIGLQNSADNVLKEVRVTERSQIAGACGIAYCALVIVGHHIVVLWYKPRRVKKTQCNALANKDMVPASSNNDAAVDKEMQSKVHDDEDETGNEKGTGESGADAKIGLSTANKDANNEGSGVAGNDALGVEAGEKAKPPSWRKASRAGEGIVLRDSTDTNAVVVADSTAAQRERGGEAAPPTNRFLLPKRALSTVFINIGADDGGKGSDHGQQARGSGAGKVAFAAVGGVSGAVGEDGTSLLLQRPPPVYDPMNFSPSQAHLSFEESYSPRGGAHQQQSSALPPLPASSSTPQQGPISLRQGVEPVKNKKGGGAANAATVASPPPAATTAEHHHRKAPRRHARQLMDPQEWAMRYFGFFYFTQEGANSGMGPLTSIVGVENATNVDGSGYYSTTEVMTRSNSSHSALNKFKAAALKTKGGGDFGSAAAAGAASPAAGSFSPFSTALGTTAARKGLTRSRSAHYTGLIDGSPESTRQTTLRKIELGRSRADEEQAAQHRMQHIVSSAMMGLMSSVGSSGKGKGKKKGLAATRRAAADDDGVLIDDDGNSIHNSEYETREGKSINSSRKRLPSDEARIEKANERSASFYATADAFARMGRWLSEVSGRTIAPQKPQLIHTPQGEFEVFPAQALVDPAYLIRARDNSGFGTLYPLFTAKQRRKHCSFLVDVCFFPAGRWVSRLQQSFFCVASDLFRPRFLTGLVSLYLLRTFAIAGITMYTPQRPSDCGTVHLGAALICFIYALIVLTTFVYRVPLLNFLVCVENVLVGLYAIAPVLGWEGITRVSRRAVEQVTVAITTTTSVSTTLPATTTMLSTAPPTSTVPSTTAATATATTTTIREQVFTANEVIYYALIACIAAIGLTQLLSTCLEVSMMVRIVSHSKTSFEWDRFNPPLLPKETVARLTSEQNKGGKFNSPVGLAAEALSKSNVAACRPLALETLFVNSKMVLSKPVKTMEEQAEEKEAMEAAAAARRKKLEEEKANRSAFENEDDDSPFQYSRGRLAIMALGDSPSTTSPLPAVAASAQPPPLPPPADESNPQPRQEQQEQELDSNAASTTCFTDSTSNVFTRMNDPRKSINLDAILSRASPTTVDDCDDTAEGCSPTSVASVGCGAKSNRGNGNGNGNMMVGGKCSKADTVLVALAGEDFTAAGQDPRRQLARRQAREKLLLEQRRARSLRRQQLMMMSGSVAAGPATAGIGGGGGGGGDGPYYGNIVGSSSFQSSSFGRQSPRIHGSKSNLRSDVLRNVDTNEDFVTENDGDDADDDGEEELDSGGVPTVSRKVGLRTAGVKSVSHMLRAIKEEQKAKQQQQHQFSSSMVKSKAWSLNRDANSNTFDSSSFRQHAADSRSQLQHPAHSSSTSIIHIGQLYSNDKSNKMTASKSLTMTSSSDQQQARRDESPQRATDNRDAVQTFHLSSDDDDDDGAYAAKIYRKNHTSQAAKRAAEQKKSHQQVAGGRNTSPFSDSEEAISQSVGHTEALPSKTGSSEFANEKGVGSRAALPEQKAGVSSLLPSPKQPTAVVKGWGGWGARVEHDASEADEGTSEEDGAVDSPNLTSNGKKGNANALSSSSIATGKRKDLVSFELVHPSQRVEADTMWF